MEQDFQGYISNKSREELLDILSHIDRKKYADQYKMVQQKLWELESAWEKQVKSSVMPEEKVQREYANIFTRFAAIVIDSFIILPFYLPIYLMSLFVEEGEQMSMILVWLGLIILLGGVVFGFWNAIIRMGKTGQSIGRKILNIAVLDEDGEPIGIGKAALREIIGRWISGIVCYIGYLNAFWDKQRQMWHDKIANCYVYYVEDNFS